MTLTSYRWLTHLLSPVLRLWDFWRAKQQPIYRPYRAERWAKDMAAPLSQPLIWIHAVSVGETQACASLLRALLQRYPHHGVLLTHMTPTGRQTGAALFAHEIAEQRLQQCYLPYDVAGLAARFLQHFKPVCGVFMETEVWPNCVAACKTLNIPLGLANARLSEKSLRQAWRFKPLAQTTFNSFTWVGAQSQADAQRLAQLRRAPITVTGNLELDASINQAQWAQGQAFKAQHARLTIALASTREGEEALLFEALQAWLSGQNPPPLILLIPRHPKRATELIELLRGSGLKYAQRSLQASLETDTQVYVCDTLGEMWFYYGASDIAVIGGGWLPLGGQNLIEPCMAGCATIVGPHMFNFADATRLALLDHAIVQTDLSLLTQHLDRLMNDNARATLRKDALNFVDKHAGATNKHMALIQACVPNL
jgi:3-deoxy-D-manno-octulosonic-acid transferase